VYSSLLQNDCVVVVPFVIKGQAIQSALRVKQSNLDWRWYVLLKCQEPLTQRYDITFQKNWIMPLFKFCLVNIYLRGRKERERTVSYEVSAQHKAVVTKV